jgi:hypothetical protein
MRKCFAYGQARVPTLIFALLAFPFTMTVANAQQAPLPSPQSRTDAVETALALPDAPTASSSQSYPAPPADNFNACAHQRREPNAARSLTATALSQTRAARAHPHSRRQTPHGPAWRGLALRRNRMALGRRV